MRIRPRQHLLDTWRAVAQASYAKDTWTWGGHGGRNSISDAEQLLCIMGPATKVDAFKIDLPDETAEDVLKSLRVLGDSIELPRRIIRLLADYLRTYTDEEGRPSFAAGTYLQSGELTPSPRQQQLDVVDSLSISVQLCLAAIGFLRVFRTVITRDALRREVDEVEAMASQRLSAAMVGLLRSFAVNVFDFDSPEGQALYRTLNQSNHSQRRVFEELHQQLREVAAGLRDLTIGSRAVEDIDNPNRLFECGWSWGIVRGAPEIETTEEIRGQPEGLAEPAPYLYFTVVALDGIQDLFTERTRLLGLLNEEQHRLMQALQLRWDFTQSYWSTIASFGDGRWPLEDIPWRTTDGAESDYFTLLVTSITVQALSRKPGADAELSRVGRVLEDLASRARITRRPFENDPAIPLHSPGVPIQLQGSELADGPPLNLSVYDFSPQLLKRTLRVARLAGSTELRGRMLELSDQIWDHLWQRRHRSGPGTDLWDQPAELYTQLKLEHAEPSWYYTERVVEALITAAHLVSSTPLRSYSASNLASDMIAEAEHLFDRELLIAATDAGPALAAVLQRVQTTLRRARDLLPEQPSTSLVLASDVLRELDRLSAARMTPTGLV
jgi:hypothetical protein